MKKIIIFTICLLSIHNIVIAESLFFRNQPISPTVHKNPYFNQKYIKSTTPQYNFPNINNMEYALFKRNYANENLNTRLSRLEENMFGETINGTIHERYSNLSNAFNYGQPNPYYNPYGHQYRGPYSPETNQKLNIINKLANFLGGTATGVSPNLDDGFSYDESYSSPFGRGYYRRNNSSGTGATIRILD